MTDPIREQLEKSLGSAYAFERELGGGGMSRVFLAVETQLNRRVVVKVLSSALAADISAERFQREITMAASLQQANIVPVLTAGNAAGVPYFTMPYVEGESLRARLGRAGPLSIHEAVRVMGDVARALAYAHDRGIVHRDIKPDNVLLSGGTAVVTDFGIAKAINASRTGESEQRDSLTEVGTAIGTLAYMAPEQAAGDPSTDHRADFYAFGCTAYELLVGHPPFVDRAPQHLLVAHMVEAPAPIGSLRADIPAPLAELIMRCLEKDVRQRPASASEIMAALDTITTTSGADQLAMPAILLGGPGMFWKALAIYAAAFIVVVVLAKAAIVGIGLPDWVFQGAVIAMAAGLPLVLWTGYVQWVARRAVTVTPTFTPGGTPRGTPRAGRSTIATLALKAAPKMSWYRTARGGAYGLGLFVALIGAAMAMRVAGIGPFGSLLARGEIGAQDQLILADFSVSGADSALGRVVSDAVRAGLVQSTLWSLMTPVQTASALQRMQEPTTTRVDFSVARRIAQREGVKGIVDGNVTALAGRYIIAVRLVTADSVRELTSFRATASGPDELIEAADEVARRLRAKAGESLRRVQGGRPLAMVTTGSLEALRLYSEAGRLADFERDYGRAEGLLRQAVALDTGFAEAWRKLAAVSGNLGNMAGRDSASIKAYQLRNRLSDRERDLIVGYYFASGPGHDRGKGITAYEALLARGDTVTAALQNLAQQYNSRREFTRAEALARAYLRRAPMSQQARETLLYALEGQGQYQALDSVIAEGIARFPDNHSFRWWAVSRLRSCGHLDDYEQALDSARTGPEGAGRVTALNFLESLARERGRYQEMRRFGSYFRAALRSPLPERLVAAMDNLAVAVRLRVPVDDELEALDSALVAHPLEQIPVENRPYLGLARALADAKRPAQAGALLARYDAEVVDTNRRRFEADYVRGTRAAIALAEGDWRAAVAELKEADRRPDGPASSCVTCLPLALFRVFESAGLADSAIAAFEQYRKTPVGSRPLKGPDIEPGAVALERVAALYALKGDSTNAAIYYGQFVELWKNADPALQPRVRVAREQIAKLSPNTRRNTAPMRSPR